MREFIITTDSTVDLPKEYLDQQGNAVISLTYIMDGTTYKDMYGLPSKEFYDKVRGGALPTTTQLNPEEAKDLFQPLLEQGKDVLHLSFSSGLSGSYNSIRIAAEELREEYPDAKLIIIDSLSASMGGGMLLYKANEQKAAGKTIDEIAEWLDVHRLKVCQLFTVDDLNHLQRGGRLSKAAAVIGTMINIKPILCVNSEGKLVPIGKARGRKKSLSELVDGMDKQLGGYENDIVMISHGDCLADAEALTELVKERFNISNVMINPIGPVIGSHAGPGALAIFFIGNDRQG